MRIRTPVFGKFYTLSIEKATTDSLLLSTFNLRLFRPTVVNNNIVI